MRQAKVSTLPAVSEADRGSVNLRAQRIARRQAEAAAWFKMQPMALQSYSKAGQPQRLESIGTGPTCGVIDAEHSQNDLISTIKQSNDRGMKALDGGKRPVLFHCGGSRPAARCMVHNVTANHCYSFAPQSREVAPERGIGYEMSNRLATILSCARRPLHEGYSVRSDKRFQPQGCSRPRSPRGF